MADFAKFAEDHVIVLSAPNGARRDHSDHIALPMTAQESAQDAAALLEAGVSVLHLHVRDDDGAHSLDVERYRAAIRAIRKKVGDDLVIQITTEAVGQYSNEQQAALVRELRPEAVSLALREICPRESDVSAAADLFAWMQNERVWPQIILYSVEDVARFDELRRRGVFHDNSPFVMFVLGKYDSEQPGTVDNLERMLAAADHTEYPWAACSFGRHENKVMLSATRHGGHVRLGFENNLQLPDGAIAADNAALIRRYVADSEDSGRSPATASEVRAVFLADR